MHAGILHMLGDGILYDVTLVGNGIELNLLCLLHELRDNDGELLRHFCGHVEEAMQLLVIIAHVHGST